LEPTDDSPEQAAPIPSQRPLLNDSEEPRVVLAAVDTSPAAQRVIAMAARFCRAFPQSSLHILHVLRFSRLDRAQAAHAGSPGMSSEAVDDAKDHLEFHKRLAARQCRNQVTGHFAAGNPTTEILRYCAELKVDLLVIATHDHSGFERLLLGSIAETLVRKAPCTVTVVRQAIHGSGD
jgi:nucleotide-binding universal stress UspA family protein